MVLLSDQTGRQFLDRLRRPYAWNYVQSYIFGAPNSGYCYPISVISGTNTSSSFFFDYDYGFEGSLCTTVVVTLLILITLHLLKRKEAQL